MKNSPLANKYGAASRYVTILMNTSGSILSSSLQDAYNHKASDILQAVFPLDQNIESVNITFMGPVTNKLGNTMDTEWVEVDMNRYEYKQIDWATFSYKDLPATLKEANDRDSLGDTADMSSNFYDANSNAQ